jgi:VWFA-related protein
MLNNKIDTDKAALLKAMETMKGPNQARYNDLRAWPRLIDEAEAAAVARGDRETTTRVVQRGCGERPEECQQLGGDEPVRQQVEAKARQLNAEAQRDAQLSLATMQTLANGLARFPGSKNVLLFTDGFFTGDASERMRAVVQVAARNNVRFSTFDARGLSRDPRTQNFMNDQPLQAAGDLSSLLGDNDADVLSSLAIDTGGEVIMNRNDLRPGIDIVAKQSGTYYMLGFAPTRQMDGEYHSISVKVTRPNVTVRARKGYVATKSTPEAAPTTTPAAAAAATATVPVPAAPTAAAPPRRVHRLRPATLPSRLPSRGFDRTRIAMLPRSPRSRPARRQRM